MLWVLNIVFLMRCTRIHAHETEEKCQVKLDLDACHHSAKAPPEGPTCNATIPLTSICRKKFNITFVEIEPYGHYLVKDLLRTCCRGAINVSLIKTVKKMSDLSDEITDRSHFIFPVLANSYATEIHGYFYIPIVEVPSVYFVTLKTNKRLEESVLSCLRMWPLMIICLLMVAVSGFIGWLLETRSNKEEFPREFLSGWFEGFWWAFISMTTVGYGDKVPKSILARLFCVLWICIGVTTFSLVTAILSSEFNKINTSVPPTMLGKYIGAIRYRLYEATHVAQNGGILVDVHTDTLFDGIHELIEMLRNETVDGFVLDKYTLLLFHQEMQTVDPYKKDVIFLKTKTRRTEVFNQNEKYSYGILVKDRIDYVFLAGFVKDNKIVLDTCNRLLINRYSSEELTVDEPLPLLSLSLSNRMFWLTFFVISIVLIIICLFGITYEIYRRRSRPRGMKKILFQQQLFLICSSLHISVLADCELKDD